MLALCPPPAVMCSARPDAAYATADGFARRTALAAAEGWSRAPCPQLAALRISLGACLLALAAPAAPAGGLAVERRRLAAEAVQVLQAGVSEVALVHGPSARCASIHARAVLAFWPPACAALLVRSG